MTLDADLSHCLEELRAQDSDRYLMVLLAPAPGRAALTALYAFNLEIAKTAEVVSEPMLGRIRLQWWRESIEGLYDGNPRRHAVIQPLERAISEHDLPRASFDALIDGREQDLDLDAEQRFSDLEALEAYVEATTAPLADLTLKSLGVDPGDAPQARAAVLAAVKAHALAGLCRALPFHAGQRRLYLPESVLREAGVEARDLLELRRPEGLGAAVAPVAERARRHLDAARRGQGAVPRAARAALLPAVLAKANLKRLAKAGHDPFDRRVQAQRPGRVWRLWLARRLNRI